MDIFLGVQEALLLSGKEFGRSVSWCFVIGRSCVDATEYFTEEIYKQCFKGAVRFFLPDYWKMGEDTDELKEGLVRKKEPQYEDLVNSQVIYITKEKMKIEAKEKRRKT